MPSASPAEAAVEFHNQLVHLPYTEQEAIRQITWKLRQLHSKNRHDAATAVALVEALAMSGEAEEAAETADLVWGWRDQIEHQYLASFAHSLVGLGMYERAIALAQHLGEGGRAPPDVVSALLGAAIGIGDAAILQELSSKGTVPNGADAHSTLLTEFESANLTIAFKNTQRSIAGLTRGVQVAYAALFTATEEGPELATFVFVALPRKERRELEQAIDDATDRELSELGLPPGAMLPMVTTTVLPHTAHWASLQDN